MGWIGARCQCGTVRVTPPVLARTCRCEQDPFPGCTKAIDFVYTCGGKPGQGESVGLSWGWVFSAGLLGMALVYLLLGVALNVLQGAGAVRSRMPHAAMWCVPVRDVSAPPRLRVVAACRCAAARAHVRKLVACCCASPVVTRRSSLRARRCAAGRGQLWSPAGRAICRSCRGEATAVYYLQAGAHALLVDTLDFDAQVADEGRPRLQRWARQGAILRGDRRQPRL